MNSSLEVIKRIYKPYRFTYKGKVIILDSSSGSFVLKNKSNNIKKLYDYLETRNFDNYPLLVDESRVDYNIFEYIDDFDNPREIKVQDMIKIVANLHNKTTYYKDVTSDSFKIIYDDIINNINYLEYEYSKLYDEIYEEIIISPSKIIFMDNYSKIMNNLKFYHEELDKWYDIVKDHKKVRVSIVHNNLSLDHFIKNKKDYLISWDNYIVDSPILDIIKLYKNEYVDINFDKILSEYFKLTNINDSEKKLFFIMISMPYLVNFKNSEYLNSININNLVNYILKTEELIRPYCFENKKE